MVAPLLVAALTPFVKDLFENGLSMLGNAIAAKGKAKVEEVLGVKLPPEGQPLTPEQVIRMRELEMTHEEALLEMAIRKQELDLETDRLAVDNTKDARSMNVEVQSSEHAAPIAKVAAYYLDFMIVGATLLLACIIIFKAVPTENKEIVYTVFGALLAHCGTILNFHRGTSSSSKAKDDSINTALKNAGASS